MPRPASLLADRSKDRRHVVDDKIIGRKRHIAEWRRMPGDDVFDATRKALDKTRIPAGRIEIVEYIRPMLFNLRFQDIAKRYAPAQAVLARPNSLNDLVIAIGEKCQLGSLIHRQENVSCQFPEIQKRIDLTGKRGTTFGQFANSRAQRRIISGILEQPHKPGIPMIFSRCDENSIGEFYQGQAELRGSQLSACGLIASFRNFGDQAVAKAAIRQRSRDYGNNHQPHRAFERKSQQSGSGRPRPDNSSRAPSPLTPQRPSR